MNILHWARSALLKRFLAYPHYLHFFLFECSVGACKLDYFQMNETKTITNKHLSKNYSYLHTTTHIYGYMLNYYTSEQLFERLLSL